MIAMLLQIALLMFWYSNPAAVSAGTINGIVLINELGGPPASNIGISAPGSNPTKTGATGFFTLQFPNAQPREVVQINVSKPGYVVVNYVQLRVILPKNPDKEILTLLICKQEERERWARQFFQLRSSEAIDHTYQEKLKQAKEEDAATIARLQQERDEARAAANRAAEELAKLKPGETNDLYAEAMSLFLNGDIKHALEILDEHKLQRSMESALRERAEAEKKVAVAAQTYLLKARILTTQFRFAEAQKIYESLLRETPDNAEAHFYFGLFNQDLNHLDDARREYLQALDIERREKDQEPMAYTLINLGLLDFAQHDWVRAKQDYEEALTTLRDLDRQHPGMYLSGQGAALVDLGQLDIEIDNASQARAEYSKAIKTLEQVAANGPADPSNCDLASAQGAMGTLELSENHLQQAREDLESALKMLAKSGPLVSEQCFGLQAGLLSDLARVENLQNDQQRAHEHLAAAVNAFDQLAQKNREKYLPDVALAEGNLGVLEMSLGHATEARRHLVKSLEYIRELEGRDRDRFLPNEAHVLYNLGLLEAGVGDTEKAEAYLEAALKIRRSLTEKNRAAYLAVEADTLNALAVLNLNLQQEKQGREYLEQSVSDYRELVGQNRDGYLPYLAKALTNLATLDATQGQTEQARARYQEALSMFGELSAQMPGMYLIDIARITVGLAKLNALPGAK